MYSCNLIRVVDGDTLILDINLEIPIPFPDGKLFMNFWARGGQLWLVKERVRLVRINAPEMKTEQGPIAKDYMLKLSQKAPLTLNLIGKDKYGRVLGDVFNSEGESLSSLMLYCLSVKEYGALPQDPVCPPTK